MNKRAFLASLLLLGGMKLPAASDELRNHPLLAPEKCASQDPDSMWNLHHREIFGAFDSEQTQDRFCEAYALNLKKWTDQKYPESKIVRGVIEASFNAAMEFIVIDVEGGRIHVLTRFPAQLEWTIWYGFNGGFKCSESRFRLEDVRTLLSMLFQAKAETWKNFADHEKQIGACLANLTAAEKLLQKDGQFYFRSHLIKLIAGWL